MTKKDKIRSFLNALPLEIKILDYVDIEKIDINNPFDYIKRTVLDKNGFGVSFDNVEKALKYIKEHDPYLTTSFKIIEQKKLDYTELDSIEIAKLLFEEINKNTLMGLEKDINNFFYYVFNAKVEEKIKSFFDSLNIDISNIEIENIDEHNPFKSIFEMLKDKDAFAVSFSSYKDAIKYLSENDPSLKNSLLVAEENYYNISFIDSIIMANLLAKEINKHKFSKLEHKINSFFKDLYNENL